MPSGVVFVGASVEPSQGERHDEGDQVKKKRNKKVEGGRQTSSSIVKENITSRHTRSTSSMTYPVLCLDFRAGSDQQHSNIRMPFRACIVKWCFLMLVQHENRELLCSMQIEKKKEGKHEKGSEKTQAHARSRAPTTSQTMSRASIFAPALSSSVATSA